MIAYLFLIRIIWGRKLTTHEELKTRIMEMDERSAIKDPAMLKKSLFVLALVLTGFVFHGALHYEPATIALFGAGILLLLSGTHEPHHLLAEVEWPTIFFFMGLFIIVGGVVKVGLIKWMSLQVLAITEGNLFAPSMVVMWFSAFASAVVDNIPYVATMNPLIIDMARQLWPNMSGVQLLHHPDLMPLWWSLALGACLGGNGTAIGASANVIVVGMSEKMGHRISFLKFMAVGMPVMIVTVAVSTVYVWLRYYVLHI
jgi:Na+/H+ antiporter NhaD/arsenite permease-like protein